MKKIKNWLIRKLGGIPWSDIPVRIQTELVIERGLEMADRHTLGLLKNGSKTNYT